MFCPKCDKAYNRLVQFNEFHGLKCKECDTIMKRHAKPPTAQKMEVLDNGIMTEKLERFQNAEELYKNRKVDES